jgi:type IV pilus assembly protein PilB
MIEFNDNKTTNRIAALYKEEEEKLTQALASQYGYEYINLHGYTINPSAIVLVPESTARQARAVVFDMVRKNVSVGVKVPRDNYTQLLIQDLQTRGFQVTLFLCSTESLEHAYERYKDQKHTVATKKGVLDISPDDIEKFVSNIETVNDVGNAILQVRTTNSPRRVSETLEIIFAGALALKASDIHIEPEEHAVRLRYRLDGVLIDIFDLESHVYGRMISRLKLLSGMALNQRQEAQDGRFQFTLAHREIEVRSSIIPGASGESIVMRLLDPGVASFQMEKLQLNEYMQTVMEAQLKRPNGLIITTGPTGSGKTTALYAFLQAVHDSEKKIITIENPVEYKLDGIVQTQTGPDYTFADGLRAILRQDPDVIMVGEIRDREVAETAIHAAQTGHLVFSTLHTNSAVGGFPRLIDLGVDPHILGSAINIILGQRLVRTLCSKCKVPYEASEAESVLLLKLASDYPEKITIPSPLTLFKGVGCAECGNTGFKGRVGVFEAIIVDEFVEKVVISDPREHAILDAAKMQKIPTMAQDGMIKVLAGITSLSELERVVDLSRLK